MTRQEYIDIIKSAFLTAGKKAVVGFLVEKFAFFSLPIVNPLLKMVVEKILTILIQNAEMLAFFTYTDFRVAQQGKAFEEAALKNHLAQQGGSDDEKKRAEELLITSLRTFVRISS